MKTVAVLLAAGKSERFGEDKLWIPFEGQPLWTRAYRTLLGSPSIDGVVVVCPPERIDEFRAMAPEALALVPGGATRTQSAANGLRSCLGGQTEIVLFHDAARPYLSSSLVESVVAGVRTHGAAFPALAVVDTVKQRVDESYVTLDRSSLVAVQTPQGAKIDLWEKAFAAGREATDDMALLEVVGVTPFAVPGDPHNRKVTTQSDLAAAMTETRTGHGYDIHRFSTDPTRPLWLGGVEFEPPGLEGHSDADALLHAVVDALMGAASLGDIGDHFPNTDMRWKDEPSATFLKESVRILASLGWDVVNIDVSVIAERPRLSGRRDEIRKVIARLAGISPDRVSIKATTNEGLGSIGRGEGVAAFAVATIKRRV